MINWKHETIKISDLKEYEHNPRKIGTKELREFNISYKTRWIPPTVLL